jgi:hypothetical protein
MMSSRYFGLPFLPACPLAMRNILVGIVLDKEVVRLQDHCLEHIVEARMLMVLLRILTWLERDQDVLLVLA